MNWRGFYTFFKREFLRFFTVSNITILPQLLTVFFYFLIFGIILGSRIEEVLGTPYLLFILPGLYVQNLIMGSYMNSSGSLFISRMWANINDYLLAPLTYVQFTLAYITASMLRGILLAIGTLAIARIFMPFGMEHALLFLIYTLLISFSFASFGIVIGLWAKGHEQLNIFLNFVVTPLTFLGGVFYSLDMVPPLVASITKLNPLFYMIAGTRYALLGIQETSITAGLLILAAVSTALYAWVHHLVKKGYHLKV